MKNTLSWLPLVLILTSLGCTAEEANIDCIEGKCDIVGKEGAVCSISVESKNGKRHKMRIESEYIPQVLACENNKARGESLLASAIAIRSFAYYRMRVFGFIRDSTDDQVYSCDTKMEERHIAAARDTMGQILFYRDTPVTGYFARGAKLVEDECKGGTVDPTNTQQFITYNQGLYGEDIFQRNDEHGKINFTDRGGLSQLGSNCLAEKGQDAMEILQFFYGADIELKQLKGACIDQGGIVGPPVVEDMPWIGDGCVTSDNEETGLCDFSVLGVESNCLSWPDPNDAIGAFCSMDCTTTSKCGYRAGEAPTHCVELNEGVGRCVVEPVDSSLCSNVEGTELQVLPRFVENSGLHKSYKAVCVPPGYEARCENFGQSGTCIDITVSDCSSKPVAGVCNGNSNIRCCIDEPLSQ